MKKTLLLLFCASILISNAQNIKTYSNGITLKRCSIAKWYQYFPSAPRRQEVVVEFDSIGTFTGYMAAMDEKWGGNVCKSCDDIINMDEFPATLLTRGVMRYITGTVEPYLLRPKLLWTEVSASDLVGTWKEIEPDVNIWYDMTDDNMVCFVEERSFTFSQNKSGSYKTVAVFPGYAVAKASEKYNAHSHSWNRNMTGGYYFNVNSESKSSFKFSLNDKTIKLSFLSGNVSLKTVDRSDYSTYDPQSGKAVKQQTANDMKTNDDVKNAKKFMDAWMKQNFFFKPNSAQEYHIYQIMPGTIVLEPINATKVSEYLILQKVN